MLTCRTMTPGAGRARKIEDPGPAQEHTYCCLPTRLVPSGIHPEEREKNCVEKAVQPTFFIINLKTQT